MSLFFTIRKKTSLDNDIGKFFRIYFYEQCTFSQYKFFFIKKNKKKKTAEPVKIPLNNWLVDFTFCWLVGWLDFMAYQPLLVI